MLLNEKITGNIPVFETVIRYLRLPLSFKTFKAYCVIFFKILSYLFFSNKDQDPDPEDQKAHGSGGSGFETLDFSLVSFLEDLCI
jgi:hypothetical protein